jgi:uncharacterized lipoprotein YmbA
MTMKNKTVAQSVTVLFGIALLFLAGCGGVSKSANYYVLSPVASLETEKGSGSKEKDIAVGISYVSLPKYLKKSQIVTRKGNNELHLAEFDRWAGKIEEDIGRVIAENLTNLLSTDRVLSYPAMQAIKLDYTVKMDISRFDGSLGGNIELISRWAIFDGEGNSVYGVKATHIVEPAQGSGYADLVAAQSRALGAFSREIADAIKELSSL